MSSAEEGLRRSESQLNKLREQLNEDSIHFQVLLKVVRQWAEDEKKYLEGKMTKDEYIKKLEQFEATLMTTIMRFHKIQNLK